MVCVCVGGGGGEEGRAWGRGGRGRNANWFVCDGLKIIKATPCENSHYDVCSLIYMAFLN